MPLFAVCASIVVLVWLVGMVAQAITDDRE